MIQVLFKGIMIGIIFGIPVGVIGTISMEETLNRGFSYGFTSGLGSSVADILYGIVGAFSLTFISDFLLKNKIIITLLGAIIITVLAIRMIISNPTKASENKEKSYIKTFLKSFVIAILNPMTIMTFLFAFTSFNIHNLDIISSILLISGIFVGSLLWWIMLCFLVDKFRTKMNDKMKLRLNKVFGVLLIIFMVILVMNGVT